jgi:hypothetical protein
MITIKETREQIAREPDLWCLHLMNFVDDFRYSKDLAALDDPFEQCEERADALLASTAEALCDELALESPRWLRRIPACTDPYFVGDLQNLKAISIVQSPLRFRMRKIFVLENFLSRC